MARESKPRSQAKIRKTRAKPRPKSARKFKSATAELAHWKKEVQRLKRRARYLEKEAQIRNRKLESVTQKLRRQAERQIKISEQSIKQQARRRPKGIGKFKPNDEAYIRKAFSFLKRLGITSSKRNARTVKKSDKRVKKLIKENKDVLEGKAVVTKVTPRQARAFKKSGAQIRNGKLVLPQKPGERIYNRQGKIWHARKIGSVEIRKIILPIKAKDIQSFLAQLNDPAFATLKPKGARWAFTFFNGQSRTFDRFEDMTSYVLRYMEQRDLSNLSNVSQEEIINAVEFFLVGPSADFGPHSHVSEEKIRRYNKRKKRRNNTKRVGSKRR